MLSTADLAATHTGAIGSRRVRAPAAGHAMPRAALDTPKLLDVDVHELAGARTLVADGLVLAEAAELAHADPGENAADRRQRHPEHFGNLGHAQPPERSDRLDPAFGRAV